MIVGSSGCGKTYFVKNVLENCKYVLHFLPENIVLHQPIYDELQKVTKKFLLIHGLPDSFEDENLFPRDQRHLIILDEVIF